MTNRNGDHLRLARKAAGLSQVQLAQKAGISRHAVSYWEVRQEWPAGWHLPWAVRQMVGVLGESALPIYARSNARAGGWGIIQRERAALRDMIARKIAAERMRIEARAARKRAICGARTRKGAPCRMKSEPGRRRCKFHGGKSTGPRTPEGKARIAEAQRLRWKTYRETEGRTK